MASRIALDRYVYEDIYPAFKAATDEKELTANLSRTFLNYLAQRHLVLTGDSPAPVADIGCGPCDTLIKYLTGVEFPPGFIVRATDYLPEYAARNEERRYARSRRRKRGRFYRWSIFRSGREMRSPASSWISFRDRRTGRKCDAYSGLCMRPMLCITRSARQMPSA
jgi:hypothetical protein